MKTSSRDLSRLLLFLNLKNRLYNRSKMAAAPMPPPTHMVTMP
jgi:hypothetical protein